MVKSMQGRNGSAFFIEGSDFIKKITATFTAFVVMLAAVIFFSPNVSAANTTPRGAGRVVTTYGNLNVRSGAGTGHSKVSSIPNGSYLTLISLSGDWWYVEYSDGKYGYCNAGFVNTVSEQIKTVKTTYGNLNVRSGAGTGYSKTDTLPSGTVVVVISESSGWSRILYKGNKTGYVSSSYLTEGASVKYSAVYLSVPSYKQTDSRWSSVRLGSSSATIGRSGCLVTDLAMTESYRTGTTVTPAYIARNEKFTSSGAIYIPSRYTNDYTSSYLLTIYNKLKAGRPVIIGGRDSSGSTHWVTVTGFSGGDSLTYDKFTINDPGSSTNKKLSQFKSKFTGHIRIIYY